MKQPTLEKNVSFVFLKKQGQYTKSSGEQTLNKSRLIQTNIYIFFLKPHQDTSLDNFSSKQCKRCIKTLRKLYPFSTSLQSYQRLVFTGNIYFRISTLKDLLPHLLYSGFSCPGLYFLFFFIWLPFLSLKIISTSYFFHKVMTESIRVSSSSSSVLFTLMTITIPVTIL